MDGDSIERNIRNSSLGRFVLFKILRFFEKRGFSGRKARHDYANDTHREARIRPFLLLILIRYVSLWKKMEIETILLFFLFFSRTRRFANVLLA